MSRKLVLPAFHDPKFTDTDISITSSKLDVNNKIQGTPINIQFVDDIGIQISYTDSPGGSFEVLYSLNYDSHHPADALWTTFLTEVIPTAASPIYIDIPFTSAHWMRIDYTAVSGATSVANVWVTGKEI